MLSALPLAQPRSCARRSADPCRERGVQNPFCRHAGGCGPDPAMPLSRIAPQLVTRTQSWPLPAKLAAAGCVVVSLFTLRWSVLQAAMPSGYPFLLFFLAVLLSASLFQRAAGYFATGLSAVLAAYFFLDPVGAFAITATQHRTAMLLFLAVAAAMVEVIGRQQDSLAHLRQSEHTRILLLREFRHRTRNDLQSLVGLLLLRARAAADPQARAGLREAANHAMALARVHTRLAEAGPGEGEEAVVDTAEFVSGLVRDIAASHAGDGLRPVAITPWAESHVLDTERAVHLGLTINELLTNALKYAFPEERAGEVMVVFTREREEFVLRVQDSGAGCLAEEEIQPGQSARAGGLGTRLLRALAAQLRGNITRVASPHGTTATLRFPTVAPGARPVPQQTPAAAFPA